MSLDNLIRDKFRYLKLDDENDNTNYFDQPCPEDSATILQKASFSWIQRVLWKGYFRGPLELSDISDIPDYMKVNSSTKYLNDVHLKTKFTLIKYMYTHFAARYPLVPIVRIVALIFSILTPLSLKLFLHYIQEEDKSIAAGWGYSFLLFFCAFILNVSQQYGYWSGMKVSLEIRGALISLLFKKMLLLSNTAKRLYNVGRILNLVSADINIFQEYFWNVYVDIIVFPLQIIALLTFLCIIVGPAGLVGFTVMILSIPLTSICASKMSNYFCIALEHSDERVQLTSEFINGIRFLKQYAWEKIFLDRIQEKRTLQLAFLYKRVLAWMLNQVIIQSTSAVVLLSTFTVFILLGHELTPSIAFTALTIFVNLRRPLEVFSQNIQFFNSLMVSSERIKEYLMCTELQDLPFPLFANQYDANKKKSIHKQSQGDIKIVDGNFDWNDGVEHSSSIIVDEVGHSMGNANNIILTNSNSYSNLNEYLINDGADESPIEMNILNQKMKSQEQDTGRDKEQLGAQDPYGTFRNINFTAPKGKLTVICGQVGSGKTSLVSALIGELYKVDGQVTRPNSISYTTQQAFLVNATLRENILFGKPYDKERYANVIYACSLNTDLVQLPGKDLTEIGDKGINLSGGQKQRISLARALYSDAECFILDEPLSAVDPEVGKHLFDHCIQGMMQGKTRILVTHQLQFIPSADHIVVIQDGNLIQGTYSELQQLGIDFESIMKTKKLNVQQQEEEEKQLSKSSSSIKSSREIAPVEAIISDENDADIIEKSKLLVKEDRSAGALGFRVYKDYIKSGGPLWFFFMGVVMSYFISQILFQGSDYWLSVWTSKRIQPDPGNKFYLLVYFGFIVSFMILLGLRFFLLSKYTFSASRHLHSRLLNNVMFASCQFFDTNPTGRILNRFSKDISDIDTIVLEGFSDVLYCGTSCVVAILIMIVVNPFICIPFLFLTMFYYVIQKVYVASSRELKRMESISLSPIFSSFTEAYNGLSTIRAFDQQERFMNDIHTKIDLNVRLYLYSFAVHRWVGTRLEFIAAVSVLLSALFSIYNSGINAGTSGLAVTTALSLTGMLNWSVRQYTELEVRMNSVDRIKNYIDTPREGKRFTLEDDSDQETRLLDHRWPQHGGIEFKNVEIRYRKTADPTLKDISFTIKPNEKVGIVGRTGAGKSTIGVSLFRMVETSKGVISIDGVDISTVGLHDLRSR
ncbi:hypothetical protein CYY_010126, partial [Polysphondylium violaceum]